MLLYLMRHGQAGHSESGEDAPRALTVKGRKQTRRVAEAWAEKHEGAPPKVFVSGLVRAVQTAEILVEQLLIDEVEIREALPYPPSEAYLQAILDEVSASETSILVVGHEPVMSHWAALLTGAPRESFHTAEIRAFQLSPDRRQGELLFRLLPSALKPGLDRN